MESNARKQGGESTSFDNRKKSNIVVVNSQQ
jgi:hypothetical protein